ncbi:S1/P1 nuclease [Paucibacter sp. R3-3]|uniref:S1/P1 nuclease n=1 Tax=Roseateles agri TaxID=3098619 RepID=A0ABU5DND6_9BURK|nr:S1/P1 nuclease [Paucibacter sp. R3-3]MDY0747639.1 S1/P1 nuclease [Paucibacter sp. R3-3]
MNAFRRKLSRPHRAAEAARATVTAMTALGLLASASNALAWGADGHRLVAETADSLLTPQAHAEVDRLLRLEPGATLVSISTWPDEVRSPTTASWHYVNFPRDGNCNYDESRDCASGACVVGALERQTAILKSDAPDDKRLLALKYVTHFVGDVHQPLHAGYADDKGGNTYQVQFAGRGTNLHSVWDSGLIRSWPGGLEALRTAVRAKAGEPKDSFAPARWAEQSCRAVAAPGFYPEGHMLDEIYASRWDSLVVDQLAAASRRLASVLNTLPGKN